jgi:hypothetical protein
MALDSKMPANITNLLNTQQDGYLNLLPSFDNRVHEHEALTEMNHINGKVGSSEVDRIPLLISIRSTTGFPYLSYECYVMQGAAHNLSYLFIHRAYLYFHRTFSSSIF